MPISFKVSFLFIAMSFTLMSCTVFSPVKNENATVYVINSAPKSIPHKQSRGFNLLVTQPETYAVYNTLQIAYTTHPYQIDYFIKSHWAETPSQMLHPLLIETLQRTNYYHAVGSTSSIGHYDYVLTTHILELQTDYSMLPYSLHLIMRAEITGMRDGKVIASKEFSATEPLPQNSPYGGVIAANRAAAKVIGQLTAFCLHRT